MKEQRLSPMGLFRTTVVFGLASGAAAYAAHCMVAAQQLVPSLSASAFQILSPALSPALSLAVRVTAAPAVVLERCLSCLMTFCLMALACMWVFALTADWVFVCLYALSRLSKRK